MNASQAVIVLGVLLSVLSGVLIGYGIADKHVRLIVVPRCDVDMPPKLSKPIDRVRT